MMDKRFLFTEKAIKALPIPEKGRDEYFDTKESSLQLRVSYSGVKTYSYFRWVKSDRKIERITIGKTKDVSLETARRKCEEYNGVMALGENPNAKKKALRSEITFQELFDLYIERHARHHKKTWNEDEEKRKNWLCKERFYTMRLSQITKNDISAMHVRIGADYPVGANRVLALTSSVFGRAIEWGILNVNPCLGIRRYKEKSRERFLMKDELPKFFEALKQLNPMMRDYFKILLFTGARRSNVMTMRWDDINFTNAEWFIPETKNGTSQRIPLSGIVLEILEARFDEGKGMWVFPSSTSKSGHIEEPRKHWEKLLKIMNIKDLRIHDLRRTMGSWQAITGASLAIIGKSLNHKSVQTTQVYARLNIDPVREAMEKAQETMLSFNKPLKRVDSFLFHPFMQITKLVFCQPAHFYKGNAALRIATISTTLLLKRFWTNI